MLLMAIQMKKSPKLGGFCDQRPKMYAYFKAFNTASPISLVPTTRAPSV